MTPKFSDILKYPRLSKYEGLSGTLPLASKSTYVGIEIELEKVKIKNYPSGTFTKTKDNSLKVDGMEFVTIPIPLKYLEVELRRLFAGIQGEISPRCSVHVHLNMRDCTSEELRKFLLLYLIFETSLFNITGNREDSTYCTALKDCIEYTKLKYAHMEKLNELEYFQWHKYTALNLAPMWGCDGSSKIGTVEFRHLHGTKDIKEIINWCNLIVSLKLAAKKISIQELEEHLLTMNTTSGYVWLTEFIFGTFARQILKQKTYKKDVEFGILTAKLVGLQQDKTKKEAKVTFSSGPQSDTIWKNVVSGPAVFSPVNWAQLNEMHHALPDTIIIDEEF